MLRTMTSRVPIDEEVAWARVRGINKELRSLSDQIKPFREPNRPHNESVDMLVQSLYVSTCSKLNLMILRAVSPT